jgi:hypothetical protein
MNPWDFTDGLKGSCPRCRQDVHLRPAVRRIGPEEATPVDKIDPDKTPPMPPLLKVTCPRCSAHLVGMDGRVLVSVEPEEG